MTECKLGDIVLVSYPFSESSKFKKRPALVLFTDPDRKPYSLVTISMISSKIDGTRFAGDLNLEDWSEENLIYPSILRLSKIATIDKSLVISKLGTLSKRDLKATKKEFKNIFSFWL